MTPPHNLTTESLPNGFGGAALLASGIGAIALAGFAIAADHNASFKSRMIFYRPTGQLSGVTTSAIVIWLVTWAILNWRWRKRDVALGRVAAVSLLLLALGLVLTFPPVGDLF